MGTFNRTEATLLRRTYDRARAFLDRYTQVGGRNTAAAITLYGFLALFANLAMLCGLFGTIVGLIRAFGAVGGREEFELLLQAAIKVLIATLSPAA